MGEIELNWVERQMENRCGWAGPEQIYCDYHDQEWGVPEYDSKALWEKLILDGFQAGLSWITVLKKRENFRRAFEGFDPNVIAEWGEDEIERLVQDAGVIRHRGKIEATIGNARAWQVVEQDVGFDQFVWGFVGGTPLQNRWETLADVPAQTKLSQDMSKALKKHGFKFCGPTIVYAWLQACGVINDHLVNCPRHSEVARLADGRAINFSQRN